MAQTAVDIVVKVVGDQKLKRLDTTLKGTAANAVKAGTGLDRAAVGSRNLGRAASTASLGVQKLNKAFLGITAVVSAVSSVVAAFNASVARTESERRIKILGETYGEAGRLAAAASASADKFGQSQTEVNNALAKTFARLRPVGVGLDDIVSTYNGFQTAARLSGTTAQESAAAFTQLAQALGAGRLAGDEFRSIAEQAPLVLQAISKETGIAVGQLKQFAADGNLTADIVIRALKRIETEGAADLEEVLKGPAQAFKNLQNAAEDLFAGLGNIGQDRIVDAANRITAVIKVIVDNLDVLGPLFNSVLDVFDAVINGFIQGFTSVIGPVEGFGQTVRKTIAVVTVVLGDLAKIVGEVFKFVGKNVAIVAKFVGKALGAVVGDVAEAGSGIVQNVSNTVRQVASLISKLINALTGLGGQLLDKLFGINLGDIVTAPLNALADGIDTVGESVSNYIQSVNSRANALIAPVPGQPDTGGSSGSTFLNTQDQDTGGGAAGAGAAQRLQQSQQLLKNAQDLLFTEQNRRKLLGEMTELEKIQQQGKIADLETKRKFNELLVEARGIEDASLQAQTIKVLKDAEALALSNNQLEVDRQIKELRENALQSIDEEIALLAARLEGTEAVYQREKDIVDLMERSGGTVTREEATQKVDTRNQLKELLAVKKEYENIAKGFASTVANGLKNVLVTAIEGGDIQEAFSQLFANLGSYFLDIAFEQVANLLAETISDSLTSGIDIAAQQAVAAQQVTAAGQNTAAATLMNTAATQNVAAATQMVTAAGIMAAASGIPGFADGGRPKVGEVSIVGERGP